MRSVPAGSFERLSGVPALWHAWLCYQRGKRRRAAVARFALDADTHVFDLHRRLRAGSWRPGGFRLHLVRDPKLRLIAVAPVSDRVVTQALVAEIAPTYERGFLADHYAACTGRGPHRAVLRHLALARRFRYRLPLDVRRYFPSIDHGILRALIARRLGDRRTLALVDDFLACGGEVYRSPLATRALGLASDPLGPGCGLAIGSYLSQWCGALYLDGLDHFIKRVLKVPGYLRYMDDFVLLDDDRARLEAAYAAVGEWLERERRLELNPKRREVHESEQPAIFLGYRTSRAGVLPGPKMRRRAAKKLRAAAARGPEALARSVRSYRGLYLF